MIKYKDFSPQVTERGLLGRPKKVETVQAIINSANQWINDNSIEVINIETVVLPRYFGIDEHATWHQFIRVWYKV